MYFAAYAPRAAMLSGPQRLKTYFEFRMRDIPAIRRPLTRSPTNPPHDPSSPLPASPSPSADSEDRSPSPLQLPAAVAQQSQPSCRTRPGMEPSSDRTRALQRLKQKRLEKAERARNGAILASKVGVLSFRNCRLRAYFLLSPLDDQSSESSEREAIPRRRPRLIPALSIWAAAPVLTVAHYCLWPRLRGPTSILQISLHAKPAARLQ